MSMRPETQARIDALHAQIAELVASEKAHHDATHRSEAKLLRSIAHASIDVCARSPADCAQMRWATATMPAMQGAAQ